MDRVAERPQLKQRLEGARHAREGRIEERRGVLGPPFVTGVHRRQVGDVWQRSDEIEVAERNERVEVRPRRRRHPGRRVVSDGRPAREPGCHLALERLGADEPVGVAAEEDAVGHRPRMVGVVDGLDPSGATARIAGVPAADARAAAAGASLAANGAEAAISSRQNWQRGDDAAPRLCRVIGAVGGARGGGGVRSGRREEAGRWIVADDDGGESGASSRRGATKQARRPPRVRRRSRRG